MRHLVTPVSIIVGLIVGDCLREHTLAPVVHMAIGALFALAWLAHWLEFRAQSRAEKKSTNP